MTAWEREPYPIEEPNKSVGELVGRISEDFSALLRDHIQLARHEITEEAKRAGKAAGLLSAAALAGWITVVMLSFALAWGLAIAFDSIALGFLVVGLIWAVVAGITFMIGRDRMSEVEPVPDETISELRKDREWLREQTS
ncbi:MAG TPA: phage holin family protein [Acidimicrobiia bacterium]|nr:phage holin family protein [Acidimicrobiia bacterium]